MTAAVARKRGASSRGGIAKRPGRTRTDRDGDLVMDSAAKGRGGGISKTRGASATARGRGGRSSRGGITSDTLQREVLRHVGDGTPKGPRQATNRSLEELRITGWTKSKAAANDDGGTTSLIVWLEKKATLKNGATKRPVRIKKSRVEEENLIISVYTEDIAPIIRMNGFAFAGANIKIERVSQASGQDGGSQTESIKDMLKGVLERRYNPELKLLDLSALGQDPGLKASQIFDSRSTTGKFFPALMKVLEEQFKSAAEKHEAIPSVTLANNDLPNVATVTTLSQTLPHLKNLDLSNNKLEKLDNISLWRRRFAKLDHLVLSGNPLEQNEPEYAKEVISWYPKLRLLNAVQVRTDEEAAQGLQVTDLPFPIKVASFQDEGQIAENFLRTFFAGFDTDRPTLATHYYDETSEFSYSLNTGAPRDPSATSTTAPQEWEQWIKGSRNLKKITQLPARQARHSKGTKAVQDAWALLPATKHPDLASDARKWLIECQTQPGIPDPTGQSPVGVDGFLITVHGEFDEMDVSTGQVKKTRSFDRTFIIGPGGPTGVRVVNDLLTIRAYGGSQAFEPDSTDSNNEANAQVNEVLGLPAGLTPELAEQMLLELQKQTNMTVQFAKDCLEQVQWNFDAALAAFAQVKDRLGPEAFVQQA